MKKDKAAKIPKTKGKKRFSLFSMLTTISLLPLILSVVIVGLVSLSITRSNLESNAQNTLYVVANNLSRYCKENSINAINVGDYYEYLDSLKDKNIEMAIIIEGTPSATSIKNVNDYRIREIPCDSADTNKLNNGYFDPAVEIDGKVYYGYYMPLEYEGKIIGMTFAGQLQDSVTEATNSIILAFVTVAVLMVVLFAAITFIFTRGLLKSVKVIGRSVNALAQGDVSEQKTRSSSVKEMNTLLEDTKQMQENLSGIIGNVQSVSDRLVGNIEDVTSLSSSSAGRAQEITRSMDELTAATVGMAEHVQSINMQMLEIGTYVN
ncbi:MAG: cache domain-containing protein, partial [Lachnospiraceae bacterium]|nr:cache domain-containing protein [Lachnospiraceae bacterium]